MELVELILVLNGTGVACASTREFIPGLIIGSPFRTEHCSLVAYVRNFQSVLTDFRE